MEVERMKFHKNVLEIDPAVVSEEICEFIRNVVLDEFKREGVVVGLSGGIDSALISTLSVKALGKENVLGVILPEKESNPISQVYATSLAQKLGIRTETINITPTLEDLGAYEKRNLVVKEVFPEFTEDHRFKIGLPQNLLESSRYNFFALKIIDPDGNEKSARLNKNQLLEMVAATDMKQRTRMIHLYYFAEKNNYLVGGTTNKTEYVQGFFVKYGDGGVDLEPIAHLYKTQVYQLAKYLDVPQEIIKRTPSPDTYSAPVSDQEFFFCLPYDLLDLLLYAWEHKIPSSEIKQVLDLKEEQIERVFKDFDSKMRATAFAAKLPPTLTPVGCF
jgi:NAD+ synthase